MQCFNSLRLQQHAAALLPGKFQEALLIYFPIAECEVDVFPERVMQVHMMEPFPARKDKGLIGIAVEIVMPDVKRQAEGGLSSSVSAAAARKGSAKQSPPSVFSTQTITSLLPIASVILSRNSRILPR